MNLNRSGIVFMAGLLVHAMSAHAAPPQVGEVKDSRSTGTFFNNLTIELKLVGDEYVDAKSFRCRVNVATDDTGRNLIDPEKSSQGFEEAEQFGRVKNSLSIELKNPARKASVVAELSGALDVYRPSLDPEARITIAKILAKTKKPVEHPALKAAGVSLAVLTSKERAEEQQAAMQAQMGEAFKGAFQGMMGGGSDNSLIYRISDPQKKLVGFSILDGSGAEIKTSMSSWTAEEKTLYYDKPIPQDAQLRLEIGTSKSLVAVPFSLTNIPLP